MLLCPHFPRGRLSDGYQAYFQRTLLSARATKCPICLDGYMVKEGRLVTIRLLFIFFCVMH
jgi:hypothetical protein